jgi:hypothetical protein
MSDHSPAEPRVFERSAVISDCGRYRYRLWRKWANTERMPVMWVMLNPSTADASIDDPTIRRCIKFSQQWGYGAMWVGNLYAFRATNPKDCPIGTSEAIGPENDRHMYQMAIQSAQVICAWGANQPSFPNIRQIQCPGGYWHLGLTANRQPKHPLARGKAFIPYTHPLTEYRV